jgi:Na+-translocating ferredoxin:NAD+ oxidoreductase RnfE subunit
MSATAAGQRPRSLAGEGAFVLLALAPLLAASSSTVSAAGLAGAVAGAFIVTRALDRMLFASLPVAVRLCLFAVLASAVVVVFGQCAAALLPEASAAWASALPLAAAGSLALAGLLALRADARPSWSREIAAVGAGALALVAVGAVREWLGPLTQLSRQPGGAFLLAGLALAAAAALRARSERPGPARHDGGPTN